MDTKDFEQALKDVRAAALLEAIAICEGVKNDFHSHDRENDYLRGGYQGARNCADKIRKAFQRGG